VATLWVRYRNGDTDAWRLTDNLAADLEKFALDLMHASAVREVIHFPVVSVEEDAPTYVFGIVSLRPEDVVAWHLEGLANEATAAALWAEMEGPTENE
jgi:chemotaxis signal transduction protein